MIQVYDQIRFDLWFDFSNVYSLDQKTGFSKRRPYLQANTVPWENAFSAYLVQYHALWQHWPNGYMIQTASKIIFLALL